jgi:D-galactarolactone isomerase
VSSNLNGSGSRRRSLPANATDCHHHVYDPRWPLDPRATLHPSGATIAEYRALQQRLGLDRHVIVQPSTYGTDNTGLVEALTTFGPEARGIAVVDASVSDEELSRLGRAGVCGVRFNLRLPAGAGLEAMTSLAPRVAELGWHVQLNVSGDQLSELRPLLQSLPAPIVLDHLGHIASPRHPGFAIIAGLIASGRAWVKLSGPYIGSAVGPPTYADRGEVARALVELAPERLVWGSDWPHPSETEKPDDAGLLDLLAVWAPDEAVRRRILVTNPEALYGFEGKAEQHAATRLSSTHVGGTTP